MLHVCLSHVLNVKCNKQYRKLTTHEKINRSYQSLRISVWVAHFIFRPHHVLKHLSVLHPRSVNTLLWLVAPCAGFDVILTCSMLNPYLGLLVSCTYPLSILQAVVVFGNCVDLSMIFEKLHKTLQNACAHVGLRGSTPQNPLF